MPGVAIKSSERTLALFELFSVRQQPLRVKDVADALEIPQPSASVLLNNLVELGYLEKNPRNRTFSPTIRVLLLGSWLTHRFSETAQITQQLRELRRTIDEAVYIGVQKGAYAQYVLVQGVRNPDQMNVRSGLFNSLTCSSTGQALLALKPDDEILGWVRRCNAEAEDERLRVSGPAFLETMAQVRAQGYAETDGGVAPGIGGIAIATRISISEAPFAIGCGMKSADKAEKREAVIAALLALKADLERSYVQNDGAGAFRDIAPTRAGKWTPPPFFDPKAALNRN